MANVKFTEFPSAATVGSTDIIPIVQGGTNKKATAAVFSTYIGSAFVALTGNQTIAGVKTFSSQLASSVATGTAPFSIASTTKVTNLNADLLDGYTSADFQLALTNPVTGTGTTNYLPKFTGTSALGNSIIQDNGSTATIGGALTATGAISTSSTIASTDSINENAFLGNGFLGFYNAANTPKYIKLYDDSNNINAIGFSKSGSVATTWFPSGNVGIGTTNPTYKLDVIGDSYTSGNIRIGGSNVFYFDTFDGGWYMQDTIWIRSYASKSLWMGNGKLGADGGLTIGYGGAFPSSGGAIISGSVGIGTTSPYSKLNVQNGNITITTSDFAVGTTGSILTYGALASTGNTGFYLQARTAGDSASNGKISINPDGGNVLIGTTTDAGYKLDINGTARVSGVLTINNGNTNYQYGGSNYYAAGLGFSSNYNYSIYNTNYGREDLKIEQATGAATFSSSVTATRFSSGNTSLSQVLQLASTNATIYTPTGYNGENARALFIGAYGTTGSFNGIEFTSGGNNENFLGFVEQSGGAGAFVIQGYTGSAYIEKFRIAGNGAGLFTTSLSVGASTNGRLGVRGTTNDSSAYAFEAANSSGNTLFIVRNDGFTFIDNILSIGTFTPDASAKVQIDSTTQGFLVPRMTEAEINAISSPAEGLLVYNTDQKVHCFYDGANWKKYNHSNM